MFHLALPLSETFVSFAAPEQVRFILEKRSIVVVVLLVFEAVTQHLDESLERLWLVGWPQRFQLVRAFLKLDVKDKL